MLFGDTTTAVQCGIGVVSSSPDEEAAISAPEPCVNLNAGFDIPVSYPVTAHLSGDEIYWRPGAVSWEAFNRLMFLINDAWRHNAFPPYVGSSFSYKNGGGRIWFENGKHAAKHFEALKAAGVIV